MHKVNSFDEIADLLENIKSESRLVTNNFKTDDTINSLISRGDLFSITFSENKTVLLFEKTKWFYRILFYTKNRELLIKSLSQLNEECQSETFIIDEVGQEHSLNEINSLMEVVDFKQYAQLQRMVKINKPVESFENDEILFAEEIDEQEIYKLLYEYFDVYREQLPSIDEIHNLIVEGNVIVTKLNNNITGFLIFEITGKTSILRYWFVHPDYRNLHIGSKLLNQYQNKAAASCKRLLLWVFDDNQNAIDKYLNNGYIFDNLFSRVYKK